MSRHGARRNDGGDERQPVGRAGHVAIRETRTTRDTQAGPGRRPDLQPAVPDATRNGSICFPSMTGRPVEWRAIGANDSRSSLAFSSRPNSTCHPSLPPRRGAALLTASTIARSASLASSGMPRSSSPESLASNRRDRTSGARGGASSSSTLVRPNRQRICGRLPPGRAREQNESDAAMNGEDRQPVVEARDVVHLGAIEQMPPQWCGAGIADEARRDDEADSPAGPDQLKGSFDEELIQVQVRAAFDLVNARLADEVRHLPRIDASASLGLVDAAVTTDHVPRRVADDRVEARRTMRGAGRAREDVRECQRPVQKAMPLRRWPWTRRACRSLSDATALTGDPGAGPPDRERRRDLADWQSGQNQAPHHRSSAAFHLPSDDSPDWSAWSVRSLARTMSAESSGSSETLDRTCAASPSVCDSSASSNNGNRSLSVPAVPAAWLSTEVFRGRADEAVAGDEMVIQEGERLVSGQGCEPQGEARQLHGHRVQVDTEQAARCDRRVEARRDPPA